MHVKEWGLPSTPTAHRKALSQQTWQRPPDRLRTIAEAAERVRRQRESEASIHELHF